MKQFLFLAILFVSTQFSAQTVIIDHEQTPGACDGAAYLDEGTIDLPTGYTWWETDASNNLITTIGSNPTDSLTGLCAGNYALQYNDSLYYYFVIDSIPCESFYVNINSTMESALNACDATITSDVGGNSGTIDYDWSNGETTPNLTNVCSGSYSLIVTDDANCSDTALTVVFTDSSAGLTAVIMVDDETVDGACDGSVVVFTNGGTAPVIAEHSDGFVGVIDSARCSGYYTVMVTDGAGDTVHLSYVVASPSTMFTDANYADSTIIDTLVSQPVENCTIDFATIDSAWVAYASYVGTDSVLVTWAINDVNGTHTIDYTYFIPGGNFEVYAFELSLFCPQKNNANIFKCRVNHYLQAGTVSLSEEVREQDILLYPNPGSDNVTLQKEGGEHLHFIVYDTKGSQVISGMLVQDKTIINISSLQQGLYFVNVEGFQPMRLVKE
ncbi:MAG: hypothetical protein COA32_16570 [Fluviicola sp.]|nr:MAG: hypothetical protein COA32_16570 [Fluviicola sp.]